MGRPLKLRFILKNLNCLQVAKGTSYQSILIPGHFCLEIWETITFFKKVTKGREGKKQTKKNLAVVFPLSIIPLYLKINNHLHHCTAFVTGGTQLCFSFYWKAVMALSSANILYLKEFDSKLIHPKSDPNSFSVDWDVFFNCDNFFLLLASKPEEKKVF